MPNLADIFRGKALNESLIDPLQAIIYKNAPIASVEIERAFSCLSGILSPQRLAMTVDNLASYVCISWNHSINVE